MKKVTEEENSTEEQVSEDSNPKSITIRDILDLVGKFVDRLESREVVKVKNILTCYVEQRVSVYC